jgi:hypothetical protein
MLPLEIAACLGSGGGVFRATERSLHAPTHLDIFHRCLEIGVPVDHEGDPHCIVRLG